MTSYISRAEEAKNMYDSETIIILSLTNKHVRAHVPVRQDSRSAAIFTGSILNNFKVPGV